MGMFLILIIIVAAGVLLYSFSRRRGGDAPFGRREDDPVEIARRRYAEGEITREEFGQIKQDLEVAPEDQ
jgi:putative membrane protein